MMRLSYIRMVLLILLASGLSACGTSPPTRFYLLSADASQSPPAAVQKALFIGVGPIMLPAYLDRRELIRRTGSNELDLAIYHQWAEPLKDSISRVIEENLGRQLGTDHILRMPVPRTLRKTLTLDYQVVIGTERFEKAADGRIVLAARWTILNNDRQELLTRRSEYTETPAADTYNAQAASQSHVLARLSEEIGGAILALEQGRAH